VLRDRWAADTMLYQQPLLNLRPEPSAPHSLGRLWKARLHLPRRHGDAADLVRQAQFARDLQLGEVGGCHFSWASSRVARVIRWPPMGSRSIGLSLPPLFSASTPGAIRTEERLQHMRYQFCGFDGLVVAPAVLGCIGIELFLERFREHNRDPHRTLFGQRTKFRSTTGLTSPMEASASDDQVLQPWSAGPRSRSMMSCTGDPERMVVRITAVSILCRRGNRRDHASRSARDNACCSRVRVEAARVRHKRKAPARREGGR
jgi:hypothetical protein